MTIVLKGNFSCSMWKLKMQMREAEQAYRRESKKLSKVDAMVTAAFHHARAHYEDLKAEYHRRRRLIQRR